MKFLNVYRKILSLNIISVIKWSLIHRAIILLFIAISRILESIFDFSMISVTSQDVFLLTAMYCVLGAAVVFNPATVVAIASSIGVSDAASLGTVGATTSAFGLVFG